MMHGGVESFVFILGQQEQKVFGLFVAIFRTQAMDR